MSKKPTVPLVDDIFHVTAVDREKKVFKSGMLKLVIFLFFILFFDIYMFTLLFIPFKFLVLKQLQKHILFHLD